MLYVLAIALVAIISVTVSVVLYAACVMAARQEGEE